MFKLALLGLALSVVIRALLPVLLPYGSSKVIAVHERATFGPLDKSIQTIRPTMVTRTATTTEEGKVEEEQYYNHYEGEEDDIDVVDGNFIKIYERRIEGQDPILLGPETVVFDHESNMYVLCHGNIILLTNLTRSTIKTTKDAKQDESIILADAKILAKSVGFPLGANFVPNTKIMYFADPILGLCRIDLSDTETEKTMRPKIELVASKFQLDDGSWSKIAYADDVAVGPKSGMIYFSDATDISPPRPSKEDILHIYKVDLMRGKKTGRLLQYDPIKDKVTVLAKDIWFANGVAVDDNEEFVMVSETSLARVLKYHLVGEKKGLVEVMATNLTGLVDGADCSGSFCYAPLPSSCPSILKVMNMLPPKIYAFVSTLLMMLPKSLSPKPERYGGVIEILPGDESTSGHVNRLFQDPFGEHMHVITGVTVHDRKLYLGSLETNFVGVIDLDLSIEDTAPFFILSEN